METRDGTSIAGSSMRSYKNTKKIDQNKMQKEKTEAQETNIYRMKFTLHA